MKRFPISRSLAGAGMVSLLVACASPTAERSNHPDVEVADSPVKPTESIVTLLGDSSDTTPVPPPAKPYIKRSLADASDEEVLRLMGGGLTAYDFKCSLIPPNRVPVDFWTMEPKKAALAVTELNQTKAHRAMYPVALDDADGAVPPEICTLAFSNSSSRCYNAIDGYYFLRVDPAGSYLAYSQSWSGGVVFYSIVHDEAAFDLRYCEMTYEDARQLAAVIWWLKRVRTPQEENGTSFTISTADGGGALTLKDAAGNQQINLLGCLWSSTLSERWQNGANEESFLNFASYLLTDVLPVRLGKRWTDAVPGSDQNSILRQDHGPVYTAEERRRLAELATRYLGMFSTVEDRLSYTVLARAAELAGALVLTDTRPLLEKIQAAIPPEPPGTRSIEVVLAERDLVYQEVGLVMAKTPEWQARRSALDAELDALEKIYRPDQPAYLRAVVTNSLRQLDAAKDPAALYAWAIETGPGSQWAMQQLSRVDPARYVQALEWWLNNVNFRWAPQLFAEISSKDPARAKEIIAHLPADRAKALAAAAFSFLETADKGPVPEERIDALLAILDDPKSESQARGEAIELLVPDEEPMRYPQREIDDVLLRLLKAKLGKATGEADSGGYDYDFSIEQACWALALRQRTDAFDLIAKNFRTQDSSNKEMALGALVRLTQVNPAKFKPKLKALILPHLRKTNLNVTSILGAFWAADLRECLPEIERLTTSDPSDYEDGKGSSYGSEVTPVAGRYHRAREIADLWNAGDPVTEIRLLTVFALVGSNRIGFEPTADRVTCFNSTLCNAGARLDKAQRQRLDEFFKFVLTMPDKGPLLSGKYREELVTLVRAEIAAK